MPANIATGANGEAAMFYAGAVPWHGLGVGVEEAQTSEEAMRLAQMDFGVELVPLFARGIDAPESGEMVEVPDRYGVQRQDTGAILGVSSERYQTFSYPQAFAFMDSLLADGSIRYESAGLLGNGERGWALASMGEGWRIGNDDYCPYLMIHTGHDASTAIQITATTVRVVCNNTVDAAIFEGSKRGRLISIRHTASMADKLAQARRALEVTTEQTRAMRDKLEASQACAVTQEQVRELAAELFGGEVTGDRVKFKSARAANSARTFTGIIREEQHRADRLTAYEVIHGITGYADHYRSGDAKRLAGEMRYGVSASTRKRAERRLDATQFGGGVAWKRDGVAALRRMLAGVSS